MGMGRVQIRHFEPYALAHTLQELHTRTSWVGSHQSRASFHSGADHGCYIHLVSPTLAQVVSLIP